MNKSQIATFNLCNNLINEFSYFHKIKKSHNTPQIIQNTQSNGNRFLNSLRNTLSKEKSISSSQNGLTENTSYSFLSILMSTILKHHLSWVYTILPSNERSKSTTTNSALRKQRAHWTSILEKTNPYNPLWAQLGDLHGAVNHPLRLVRTVVIGKNKEIVERLLVLLSYFIRCGNSSYYDISAENFDFGMLSNKALSKDISSPSSSMPSSQSQATNVSESLKKFKYQSSFDEDEKMDMTSIENHLEDMNTLSLDSKNLSREVNIFDLNIDPLSQFTAVLGIYSAAKNGSEGGSNSKNFQKSSRQNRQLNSDELNYMSSLSSSSSITSPSSCSMSSSPLSLNLKNLKKNSSTILEVNTKQHPLMIDSSSTTLTHKERLSPGTKKPRVSNNSFSNSYGENNCTAQELPLIGCKLKPNYQKSTRMQDNFGYSLLASYCDEFVFEFVLQGTSDRSFLSNLHERLVFSKMNSIIDCPIQEAVYIVVDVDELDVKVYSSEHACMPVKEKPVHLVDSMLTSVLNMIKLFKSSEFVLLHLEDKLQEFYNKAITLNQLKSQSSSIGNDMLIQLMELNDDADLDFLNRILQAVDIPEIF